MPFIAKVRRWLSLIGLVPSFTNETIDDAETESLVVQRSKTMGELDAQTKTFYAQSADIEAKVKNETDDISNVLDHLSRVSKHATDARTIIEQIIARRERRKLYSHDRY